MMCIFLRGSQESTRTLANAGFAKCTFKVSKDGYLVNFIHFSGKSICMLGGPPGAICIDIMQKAVLRGGRLRVSWDHFSSSSASSSKLRPAQRCLV